MKEVRRIRVFLILLSIFLILSLSMTIIAANGDFTIEKFWEKGGRITFEKDIKIDFEGDLFDTDTTYEGKYEFNGSSTGKAVFNYTIVSPADEYVLDEATGALEPDWYTAKSSLLEQGDAVDYNFTVNNGYLDFIIFNYTQFGNWILESEEGQTESMHLIHTNIGDSGTFSPFYSDTYVFVWWSNGDLNDNSVNLQYKLYLRLVEKILSSEYIEIDPIMLETTEGDKFTSLGMDTSNWEIDGIITFDIEDKDVEFSIIREEDFTVSYNNESTEIPAWVLEIKDHETKSIEEDDTYTKKTDYKIWKSKYSGITLKMITDSEVFNGSSSLVATLYDKYTVLTVENVLLIQKSSSIFFPIVSSIIAVVAIILYQKKRL